MRNLLIVDDSEDLLYALRRLISFYDFTVQTATDYKSFCQVFKSFKPEIIVLDVLLNGEDGREICRTLRKEPANKNIALLLFSASPIHLANFEECGADGFIEKPFGIKKFIEQIDAAIQSRKDYLATH